MARRDNSPRRRVSPSRVPASRILVVCCGQTEKVYLEGLKRLVRPVTLKPVAKVGSPAQLVRYAQKLRELDPGGFDDFWCVVDVDDFDIDEAVGAAKAAKISLAVSNPCFEVSLILHFDDCTAGLSNAKAAVVRLRKCLPAYEKGLFDFAVFAEGVTAAITRAKLLDERGEGNPSTGVWRLVEAVLRR